MSDAALNEAQNVVAPKMREDIRGRAKALRDDVQLDINTLEHWNRMHPDEQIDTAFEYAVLAYLDGKGPMPELPTTTAPEVGHG